MPKASLLWEDDELRRNKDIAAQLFIDQRGEEGALLFHRVWSEIEPQIRVAMQITDNLRVIDPQMLLTHKSLWRILRYFGAPPISEEDLWSIVGKKFKVVRPATAERTAAALTSIRDTKRLPWITTGRDALPSEIELAISATTTVCSHETLKTERRKLISQRQEEAVATALTSAGLQQDVSRTAILRLDQLADKHFSRERKVDGAKCDIPIRMADGRLLAIECKVSNGPKNGWKRLQREVGGKAEHWREEFGSTVLTGAVLAGSFDLSCLRQAQNEQGVIIFWQHDLGQLAKFVAG